METGHLRTRDDLRIFFGLYLILEGKLDDERREDLFFWSSPIFLVETETENCIPTLSKFLGTLLEVKRRLRSIAKVSVISVSLPFSAVISALIGLDFSF